MDSNLLPASCEPMDVPEERYVFRKDDRERIKGSSLLPAETLRYIEALEKVAHAAFRTWAGAPDDLYDALAVVDFMYEG